MTIPTREHSHPRKTAGEAVFRRRPQRLSLLSFTIALLALVLAAGPVHSEDMLFGVKNKVYDSSVVTQVLSVRPADMNGDGLIDVVLGSHRNGRVHWAENTGSGGVGMTLQVVDPVAGVTPWSAEPMDFDGDGDLDLAVPTLRQIVFLENLDGRGGSWARYDTGHRNVGVYDTTSADLDGDGDLDLIVAGSGWHMWLENLDGRGRSWSWHNFSDNYERSYDVSTGDMDGDGDIDVVYPSYNTGEITVYENLRGDASSWRVSKPYKGGGYMAAAAFSDIDGDDDLDIVFGGHDAHVLYYLENVNGGGRSWARHEIYRSFSYLRALNCGDYDRDGDVDIVAADAETGRCLYAENVSGDARQWKFSLFKHEDTLDPNIGRVVDIKAADLDGDGFDDLLLHLDYGVGAYWARQSPRNYPPEAAAGPDFEYHDGLQDETIIPGRATDSSEEPPLYRWAEGDRALTEWRPAGVDGSAPLDLAEVSYFPVGQYELTLEVDDGQFLATDDLVLTVLPPLNEPPLADAGPASSFFVGEQSAAVLEGSAEDPDGDALMYRWYNGAAQLTDWTPVGSGGEAFLYLDSAPLLEVGEYVFTLEVTDGIDQVASETVLAVGYPPNTPPEASAGSGMTVYAGWSGDAVIEGSASDADGDALSYQWLVDGAPLTEWIEVGPAGAAPLYLTDSALWPVGEYSLVLLVNDGEDQAEDRMLLTVELPPNEPPSADAGPDISIHRGAQAETLIQGLATDPDGDSLEYRWLMGDTEIQAWDAALSDGAAVLDLSAIGSLALGEHVFTLEVFDGRDYGAGSMTLTVVNRPPSADAGENVFVESMRQDTVTLAAAVDDPDGDPVEYRWSAASGPLTSWLPAGAGGSAALDLADVPLFAVGEYTLTLEASDGRDVSVDEMLLSIGNTAPGVVVGGGGVVEIHSPVLLTGQVFDFDGDVLTYRWLEGDRELYTGTLTTEMGGDPVDVPDFYVSDLRLGLHSLTLAVDDGHSDPVKKHLDVEIVDTAAPTLSPEVDQAILWPPNHRMVQVVVDVNAHDNSGLPLTISAEVSSDEPEEPEILDRVRSGRLRRHLKGRTSPDWTEPEIDQEEGLIYLKLRAERSPRGDGREYTIRIRVQDYAGNVSSADAKVLVPHHNEGRWQEAKEKRRRPLYRVLRRLRHMLADHWSDRQWSRPRGLDPTAFSVGAGRGPSVRAGDGKSKSGKSLNRRGAKPWPRRFHHRR